LSYSMRNVGVDRGRWESGESLRIIVQSLNPNDMTQNDSTQERIELQNSVLNLLPD
jgi:hypothetical protein